MQIAWIHVQYVIIMFIVQKKKRYGLHLKFLTKHLACWQSDSVPSIEQENCWSAKWTSCSFYFRILVYNSQTIPDKTLPPIYYPLSIDVFTHYQKSRMIVINLVHLVSAEDKMGQCCWDLFSYILFLFQMVPPGGNTTFDVVFLARQTGSVENTLYIHTSQGSFKYQVSISWTLCYDHVFLFQ